MSILVRLCSAVISKAIVRDAGVSWVGAGTNEDRMAKLQCVRCLRHGGDVDRAHFFLCPDCADIYGTNAFRGSAPLYEGAAAPGRCESCDQPRDISYRQWLLCGYCTRVVQSYRMGRVSSAFALDQLRTLVQPRVPHLIFEEADPVLIQATAARGRRRQLATKLDLEALHAADRTRTFWIELKTGPGAIDKMAEFQLDCSDCDDIMNVVRTSGLPAFLVHCQIVKVPEPPTMRLAGDALWWTDLASFEAAFEDVHARRGNERKQAAYFDPSCFKPIESFGEFLVTGGLDRVVEALAAGGCPQLYRLPAAATTDQDPQRTPPPRRSSRGSTHRPRTPDR
jgi:hypothetical protein